MTFYVVAGSRAGTVFNDLDKAKQHLRSFGGDSIKIFSSYADALSFTAGGGSPSSAGLRSGLQSGPVPEVHVSISDLVGSEIGPLTFQLRLQVEGAEARVLSWQAPAEVQNVVLAEVLLLKEIMGQFPRNRLRLQSPRPNLGQLLKMHSQTPFVAADPHQQLMVEVLDRLLSTGSEVMA